MSINLTINNQPYSIDLDDEQTPLLWVIRDILKLKGTKYGCGLASCGSCTILIDGEAVRSCTYPVSLAANKTIVTIEGLGSPDDPHPVQQAWIEENVPQCGYCQPGFIMATAALLNKFPRPTDEQIDEQITNVCRCATYYRMRKAIHRASDIQLSSNLPDLSDE